MKNKNPRHFLLGWLLSCCFILSVAALGGFTPANAQEFGQNKVQYHPFLWSYYRTEHFDIYFPQGADLIATFAASHVEEMYKSVNTTVGHKLTNRVPIIIHNSHAEFEQTNVIRLPLHEGIGGFTEIFKNRIVLPFEGSYTDFYHVLKHEMTHAVMFDKMFGEGAGSKLSNQEGQFPLWVSEGLAEYVSLGWDLSSEFFMIDATTFGYVQPPTEDFGGFLAYKGGQLFFHFMESAFGKGSVKKLIQAMDDSHDLPAAFKKATKMSLEEAGEIWLRELRYLYWPELGQRKYGKNVARRLTEHGKDLSFYNLQPSISPDGKEIAFFSDRDSWEGIFILNIKTEKVTRSVIQGGNTGAHESFHSFKSGITWSPDSKQLAIVSKSHGKDVINIIDAKKGKVLKEIAPNVQAILSPNWSRDGSRIVFSGMQDGLTDIYVWDLVKASLTQLTHDLAHDDKPVFSPSGKWIAFETDRPDADLHHTPKNPLDDFTRLLPFKDIYKISISGDTLIKVAGGNYDEKEPSYGPSDTTLMFISNRSGIDNIYMTKDSGGVPVVHPISNLLTGCFTPSWSQSGSTLAFSLFEEGGWDIFLMKDPVKQALAEELPKTRFIKFKEDSTVGFFRPVSWTNLSSYNADSIRTDSLAKVDSLKAKASKDSLAKIAEKKSADKKDSAALARKDSTADAQKASAQVVAKADQNDSNNIEEKKKGKKKKDSVFLTDSSSYLASDNTFMKKKYKPIWSLDNANAALGVDNQYGYGGLAYITLSDLMGDQELSFALSINGSWENTNGAVTYDYLAYKTDFSISAYHQAQLSTYNLYSATGDSAFLDRQYGFGGSARYPFTVFTRLEFEMRTMFTSRTLQLKQDGSFTPDDRYPEKTINALFPTLRWVHDNSSWGIVGPVNGERVAASVTTVPPVFQDRFAYWVADFDARKYWEFFKKYSLAMRVSSGASEAIGDKENPHQYYVGGENFNLNGFANPANRPQKLEDFYFSQFDFPLRGFDYYEFRGTRKFVSNFEFRFPFIREFSVVWPIPLVLRYVMGNVFADYGGAWSTGNAFDEMGLGMGFGMQMNLGIFVLKYSEAWAYDGIGTHQKPQRTYWSLGAEF